MAPDDLRPNPPEPPQPAGFRQPAADSGLSLEQLNQAFAEMLGTGDDPYNSLPAEAVGESLTERAAGGLLADDPAEQHDDRCEITPRSILEAMLFVGHPQNQPLSAEQVAALMRGVRTAEIDELVRDLNQQYAAERRPYTIVSQGAGYRLSLRPQYDGLREKFYGRVRQARLSGAAVDVLALVGYHGHLTAQQVSDLRGMPSREVLTQLVRRQLLAIQRDPQQPKHPRYVPTQRFLDLFGLESLADLPQSQDLDKR